MKKKTTFIKAVSVILAAIMLFGVCTSSAFAYSEVIEKRKTQKEETRAALADEIVAAARAQIGFYENNINKFTSWYYGYDTDAYWCTVFVSWCADQVGALGTAVPKRAACSSMKNWFKTRGEYYPASSGYIPQKGDIAFLNTAVDGSDDIHHVEIVTQSGFITKNRRVNIRSIGGNTSDLNYNGSEYVTEKYRPVNGSRAAVVGYAHPSYDKSTGIIGASYSFADDSCPAFFKYIYAKMLEMLFRIENFFEYCTKPIRIKAEA